MRREIASVAGPEIRIAAVVAFGVLLVPDSVRVCARIAEDHAAPRGLRVQSPVMARIRAIRISCRKPRITTMLPTA